ncbi:hypothetical protein Tco_0223989 [Tanacetum coccineum]
MMPSTSQEEIPPPPPPPPSSQTPTQQTPHTVSTIKLPILKKGEYDIWAMKMEHYLAHIDYPIWEVIQNGNGPVSITTDTLGHIKVLPPRTAEEIVARERERKARTTLLMALPKDYLAKFHKMTDAKEMWDAIKSRFGGNDESKKMQKYILKQQFEGFSITNKKGLHKVRNSRNKPVVAKVSSSTSTPGISSDVAELKDMVKALLLDKKNQSPAPTPVKVVEESCVTCGGAHSYQTCPATTGNVYRDNIQEYVSQAAAANYNQGNTSYRAPILNQIQPPGFPPA